MQRVKAQISAVVIANQLDMFVSAICHYESSNNSFQKNSIVIIHSYCLIIMHFDLKMFLRKTGLRGGNVFFPPPNFYDKHVVSQKNYSN